MSRDSDRIVFNELLEHHDREFRDPLDIVGYWQDSHRIDLSGLEFQTIGDWWDLLARLDTVLLVSREYEHLLLAIGVDEQTKPDITMMRLPHPSGIAVDHRRKIVHAAATRNPNQIYDLMPVDALMARSDLMPSPLQDKPLVPVRTKFFPGCFYIHDLAMIGDCLYANSVGQNAVIKISDSGTPERVWWPKCIETDDGPMFGANYLQLNSIAAGFTIEDSFFSASTDELTGLRPGDPDFPVDGRGVIFSGATREPIVRGLTRPHSARLYNGRTWVDNSGYGQVGYVDAAEFQPIAALPGWTRGLCFKSGIAFVGVSKILPRFSRYAPGLDAGSSVCGVYALDAASGRVIGAMIWPHGNQIFAVEAVPRDFCTGLPFRFHVRGESDREKHLFYCFQVPAIEEE